jgi:tetratricopeptide (TPR) repeat protein
MRSGRRTALTLIAIAAVLAGIAVVLWNYRHSKNPVDAATIYGWYLAVVSLAITLLMGVTQWWSKGRHSAVPHVTTAAQIRAAADWLAEASASKWQQEAAARRIITPAPATVRWRWAAEEITTSRAEVSNPPAPGSGPVSLPDLGPAGELLASGVVMRLHDEVYARLPHGRLVLIGGPGAGKTGAMILLLLAALEKRIGLPDHQRDRMPVPVWLTLGGWDPAARSLLDWVAATLNRDYPDLRAPEYGPDAAGELIRAGRIAMFLDGLDEMPEGLRTLALRRIDGEARGLRVVMTSRPEEYRAALEAGRPDNTAVIELRPVRPDAAAAYLLRDQAGPRRQQWEQVGAYLRDNPYDVAARALDNPLTLSLTRDTYAGHDPTVLTDTGKFPTVEAIRRHLMDRFLVVAYPSQREREHAVYWLAWIARHMGARQDLQWWDIPGWVPPWKLRLGRGLVAGVVAALAVTASVIAFSGNGSAEGLLAGAVFGLGAGLMTGLVARLKLTTMERAHRSLLERRLFRATLAGTVGGIVFAIIAIQGGSGLGDGIWTGVVIATAVGFGFWFGARLGFGLAGAPQTLVPRWPRPSQFFWVLVAFWFPLVLLAMILNLWATPIADSPSSTAVQTYRADRRTSIIYGLAYAIPVALLAGTAAATSTSQRHGSAAHIVVSCLGWAILAGFATWLAAWLVAGQFPLVKLSELVLMSRRRDRVHFMQLLKDALEKQVLRQVGPVYQFRHAVFQAHLAAMPGQPHAGAYKPGTSLPGSRRWPTDGNSEHVTELFQYYARNFVRQAAEPTTGPAVAGDVPRLAPDLQARADLTAELVRGQSEIPLIRLVTGVPGAGKTQLAAAYARSRIHAAWRLVAWVNAGNAVGMLSGLSEAAIRLGIGDPDANLEATGMTVRHWLEADGSRCLVVLDEVSAVERIRPYLPVRGKAQVLIICAGQDAPAYGLALPVSVFSEREALSFLCDRTGLPDDGQARTLVSELGYLPLALAHAGGMIAAQRLSYDAYLARLRACVEGRELTQTGGEPYPPGLAETVVISLDALATEDRGLCRALMDLVSVLSSAGLPRGLLHAAAQAGLLVPAKTGNDPPGQVIAPQAVDQALGKLAAASLLTFTGDNAFLGAHRLVMQVVRGRLARGGDLAATAAGAAALLSAAAESLIPLSMYRAAARDLVQQIIALNEHIAPYPDANVVAEALLPLRNWALSCLNQLGGNPAQAVAYGEILVSDLERIHGPEHADTLAARNNLAVAYQAVGRAADAIPMFERTLADRERILGPGHPDVLITRSDLAVAYYAAGRAADAIPLLRHILADRERFLGPDHPDTLVARNYLALAYMTARWTRSAIPLLQWNLADGEGVFGLHHPDTQCYRYNLAMAYLESRRYSAAIPLFERYVTDSERLLRSGHPLILAARGHLADAYQATGQTRKEIPLLKQNLSDYELSLDLGGAAARQTRSQLARAYQRTRRTADAIPLLERNLGEDERVLGSGHPDTLAARHELIGAYLRIGRTADAIPLLERDLSDYERTLGPGHGRTRAVRNQLARAVRTTQARTRASSRQAS